MSLPGWQTAAFVSVIPNACPKRQQALREIARFLRRGTTFSRERNYRLISLND
jgi:hypothetical protein